ncbi:ATP-dependent 3'-5' DNA helicase [Ascochyta rabiei]|uniref:ATP-dependent 3'-5' DNA helicase n=1 Tax=Didymella rabiei TaxID=5454 RepID=UPI0021FA566C|nr:ATP-dependent 3'-5' DNA helicase [Ascochyta rabiei]UPX20824.1 ATP-dependent 3'-5' DNA helicase [Ascochyta rabiei]
MRSLATHPWRPNLALDALPGPTTLHGQTAPSALRSTPHTPYNPLFGRRDTLLSYTTTSIHIHTMASTNYREAFQLFDKRGNGRVDRGSLGDLLRACGQNPTLAEITDLERGVGTDFDFDTFSKILNRPGGFREPFDIEEYIRGFQVFDKDRSGFVGKGQIKYILTNLGEKMTEEEVDELFKSTIDASNDEVDYREFVKTIAEN